MFLKNRILTLFLMQGMSLETWQTIGVINRELALYQPLISEGMKLQIVSYGGIEDESIASELIGVTVLCNKWNLPIRLYAFLIPYLHRSKLKTTDIIKVEQMKGADVALRSAQLWKKPFIARMGYMFSEFQIDKFGAETLPALRAIELEERIFEMADRIVVTTEEMAKSISERISLPPHKLNIISNYVDVQRFKPLPQDVERDIELLYVGRLDSQKNIAALLEAIEPLDVTLTIVGSGKLEEQLKAQSKSLSDRVQWIGNVANDILHEYYQRAKIYVQPSLYEGHPKTIIEAMACGLPVIGGNSRGINNIIHHGENGFLCDTDATGIRMVIQSVLDKPEDHSRIGANARKTVIENFSLDKVVEKEKSLYLSLL